MNVKRPSTKTAEILRNPFSDRDKFKKLSVEKPREEKEESLADDHEFKTRLDHFKRLAEEKALLELAQQASQKSDSILADSTIEAGHIGDQSTINISQGALVNAQPGGTELSAPTA